MKSIHPEYAPAVKAMFSKIEVGQHLAVAMSFVFQRAAAGLHWAR